MCIPDIIPLADFALTTHIFAAAYHETDQVQIAADITHAGRASLPCNLDSPYTVVLLCCTCNLLYAVVISNYLYLVIWSTIAMIQSTSHRLPA